MPHRCAKPGERARFRHLLDFASDNLQHNVKSGRLPFRDGVSTHLQATTNWCAMRGALQEGCSKKGARSLH